MKSFDKIVLKNLKSGDEKTFEYIFNTYYDSLINYANEIIKDIDTAEEIVEEVFIKIWEQHSKLNINTSLKSYLYKSVYNTSLNHIKHIGVKNKYKSYFMHHMSESSTSGSNYPMSRVIEGELEEIIKNTISELPKKCREIFLLSRYEQLKNDEIAEKLGIAVTTVKTQIGRALKKFKESLSEYLPIAVLFFFVQKIYYILILI